MIYKDLYEILTLKVPWVYCKPQTAYLVNCRSRLSPVWVLCCSYVAGPYYTYLATRRTLAFLGFLFGSLYFEFILICLEYKPDNAHTFGNTP